MIRETAADSAAQVAEALLGARVDAIEPVRGGRNSRVYRVEIGGRRFALKRYPSRADDPRDRLETEVEALNLLAARGLSNIPRVIAVDRERNFALLSWLDGVAVTSVGVVGDSGMGSPVYLLNLRGDSRTRLVGSAAAYRRALAGRGVLRIVTRATLGQTACVRTLRLKGSRRRRRLRLGRSSRRASRASTPGS